MSVLAPLYFLGLAAITLPLVFHLIRRSPRGEMLFSSSMFLTPSPPRLTRHSRLDNLLLLLLRGLALALLACAFARPFLREAARLTLSDVGQEHVAVVVDTSSSMRRGDLWQQALRAADEAIGRCRPQDRLAVFAFDDTLRPVASFDDLAQVPPASRAATVRARLDELTPTWAGTHLGQALADGVVAMSDMREDEQSATTAARRVVLISDMQAGGRLAELAQQAWPKNMRLELVPLAPQDPTNAGLERLVDAPAVADESDDADTLRIRVTNAADSDNDQFQLQWADGNGAKSGKPIDVYAPVGESRVTRVTPPPATIDEPRLVLAGDGLAGDGHDFDNTLYFLPAGEEELTVVYIGSDTANDAEGMRYYLERAVDSDPLRTVHVESAAPDDATLLASDLEPQLVVVTATPSGNQVAALRQYVDAGGKLLYVVTNPNDGQMLAELLDAESLEVSDAEVNDYTMFGQIAFDHPLFASMAGPQFNDFTQIRFWKYRRLDSELLPDAQVIARFENNDPAILEQRVGAGKVTVFTTGWQPADGQLARTWKFLLMLSSMVEGDLSARSFQTGYTVGDRVTWPSGIALAEHRTVTKPGGDETIVAADAEAFTDTDRPGVYTLSTADGPAQFVVHVDPHESDTTPLAVEAFEQLGCRLTDEVDPAQEIERIKQMRDVELESRQKIWKWLVAAALVVLIIETALAGWYSRVGPSQLATA